MKERKDMDKSYMWDLTPIFADKSAWEAMYSEAEGRLAIFDELSKSICDSADNLYTVLSNYEDIMQKIERIYIYTMLLKDSDGGEAEYQDMNSRAEGLFVKFSTAVAFIGPSLIAMPSDRLEEYLKDERLAKYRRYVRDVVRAKAHTLDLQGERMLSMLSECTGTPSDAYNMLFNVDVEYPKIKDDDGNEVTLSQGNFGVYRSSKIRSVRENAFEKMFGTYKKFINTSATLYSGSVKNDNFSAKARNFESSRAERLFSGNVPEEVYDSLISELHNGLDLIERYIKVRKKALGKDEIDMYDMYTPIVEDADFDIPFDNTREILKKALAPLGERYIGLLDRAFDEHWIDVYENKGKRSGAYSCGVYGVHPYVLLNYTNQLDDLYTVAHELGHSMHSFFSGESQEYIDSDYTIMAAEVASTVNEVFLTMYLLKTTEDKKQRAYVLNHFMEGFRTTVYRQTLFAEFEHKAHMMQKDGTPLTASTLSELYKSLLEEYYKGAKINDMMAYEWSYIPHFYRAYYVYQYATGFCSAVSIVNNVLSTGNADNYLKFLSLGGSDYPIEELKVAGVDLTKPDTVRNALKVFSDAIEEFAALTEEK